MRLRVSEALGAVVMTAVAIAAAAIALALSDAGNDGETAAAITVALDLYLDGGVHDQEPGFITIRSEEGSAWGQKQFNFRKNPKQ